MINNLISQLFRRVEESHNIKEPEAFAALMVRIARADDEYLQSERDQIEQLLAERYNLSPFEAVNVRSKGEELELSSADVVRFTRNIKDALPPERRSEILEALWTVVLADSNRDPHEDAQMRLVSNLLGVSDIEHAKARIRADRR